MEEPVFRLGYNRYREQYLKIYSSNKVTINKYSPIVFFHTLYRNNLMLMDLHLKIENALCQNGNLEYSFPTKYVAIHTLVNNDTTINLLNFDNLYKPHMLSSAKVYGNIKNNTTLTTLSTELKHINREVLSLVKKSFSTYCFWECLLNRYSEMLYTREIYSNVYNKLSTEYNSYAKETFLVLNSRNTDVIKVQKYNPRITVYASAIFTTDYEHDIGCLTTLFDKFLSVCNIFKEIENELEQEHLKYKLQNIIPSEEIVLNDADSATDRALKRLGIDFDYIMKLMSSV
jgi:hypothetical protein